MFSEYLKRILEKYKTGESLEHAYRTDLENLLNKFLADVLNRKDLKVIQEPRKGKLGTPD